MEFNDKYRIEKRDARNWVIERYIPPLKIKFGPKKGQMSEPTWVVEGFYGKVGDMTHSLLELALSVPKGNNLNEQVSDLKVQIESALITIQEFLKEYVVEGKSES